MKTSIWMNINRSCQHPWHRSGIIVAARPRRPAPDPGCGVDGAEIDNKNKQHFFGFLLSKIGSYFFSCDHRWESLKSSLHGVCYGHIEAPACHPRRDTRLIALEVQQEAQLMDTTEMGRVDCNNQFVFFFRCFHLKSVFFSMVAMPKAISWYSICGHTYGGSLK